MNPQEQELLSQVFAHESGAFEALLERYRALIYSVFWSSGFDFPRDYHDDLFQGFVIKLAANDYHKLRAFEGRNACSLATFLQVVATRFALDERRRWKRQPRAAGRGGRDEDEPAFEHADPAAPLPEAPSLDREKADAFHNLLFSLDWKRVSAVLWVFREVTREQIAEVMGTSRANIDALYKRAKDQMTLLYSQGSYRRRARELDPLVLTPPVEARLRALLATPSRTLFQAILQPGAKRRALLALVLLDYPRYRCTQPELARLAKVRPAEVEATCLEVLDELASRLGNQGLE
ncbi:MAG TPA: sigma-70 family RNA polymerase sigma factor [Planctomycetota bacterium]|nr:sigma-70 family RNA polymerase sigma factor [Planctomycetota bacterium]